MYPLETFLDRTNTEYLTRVANLLSYENLYETAKPLEKNDRDDVKLIKMGFHKKATVYFSGLASLTLFGTGTKISKDEVGAKAFKQLLETVVDRLNNNQERTAVQIKLLFAYPYSNFMYDMLYLETYDQQYLSAECMRNPDKYEHTFKMEPKLTLADIAHSTTYNHLKNTLIKIQQAISNIETSLWNIPKATKKQSPNNITVKFSPINILCCMLRINNVIVCDPYIYSKKNADEKFMALLTPVTWLQILSPKEKEEKIKNKLLSDEDNDLDLQFCSFISHFKYLWEHPLTLYSTDATEYKRGNKLLYKIHEPAHVTYERKGNRILKKLNEKGTSELNSSIEKGNKARADNWKQYLKYEFLQNCSKVLSQTNSNILNKEIQPLKIFIIGAWKNGSVNNYMYFLKSWIEENLSVNNVSGLQLQPSILQIKNGEYFTPKLYKELNSSNLGIVFQTKDIELEESGNFSRPNIYLEKGYLMGKFKRSLKKDTKEEVESVFVYKEIGVELEGDNKAVGYTEFNKNNLKYKIHHFIFWLWCVTQINSEFALHLMEKEKPKSKKELRDYNDNLNTIKNWIE